MHTDQVFVQRWDMREHARAHRAIVRHMAGGRWLRWLGYGIMALVVLLVGLSLLLEEGERRDLLAPVVPWLLVLLIWFGLLVWGGGWIAAWRFRRTDPAVHHEMQRVISADGVKVVTSTASIHLNWSGIVKAVETPEFFLFYFNRQSAYYLPKRSVAAGDLARVRDTLRAHLGDRARLAA